MIMTTIKIAAVYLLGILVFPLSWLREQPHAITMAYWDSIGSAHEWARNIAQKSDK